MGGKRVFPIQVRGEDGHAKALRDEHAQGSAEELLRCVRSPRCSTYPDARAGRGAAGNRATCSTARRCSSAADRGRLGAA